MVCEETNKVAQACSEPGCIGDASEVVARLQGRQNLAALVHDDLVWSSVVRRVSVAAVQGPGLRVEGF